MQRELVGVPSTFGRHCRIPTRSTSTLNGFVPCSVKALDSSDLATSPIKLGLQE